MSSVDKGITLLEITFSGQCHLWTKALIMLYLCPLMKHSAGNVICGQRYSIIRDKHSAGNVISGQRYNIIRDNIQRAISSVDKGITLLEISFIGQSHLWKKV